MIGGEKAGGEGNAAKTMEGHVIFILILRQSCLIALPFAHFHPKIKQTCRLHGFNHQHLSEAPSLMRRLVGLTDGQHGATSSTFIWMDRPANRSSHNGRRRPPSLPSVVTVTAHLSLHLAGANLIGLTQSVPSGTALRSAELRGGR